MPEQFFIISATLGVGMVSNKGIMTDDRALVSKILNGNSEAFKLLIRQNERLVVHMIGRLVKNHEEVEEICQDVFLKVYEKLEEFNFQSKLSTWIATIAYRHGINYVRKQKMSYSEIPDEHNFTRQFISEENPEKLVEEEDYDSFILTLVEKLPAQYKIVLTLYHLEGMNYDEIGKTTGMPEGTVKNYLFRARLLLKEMVLKKIPDEQRI